MNWQFNNLNGSEKSTNWCMDMTTQFLDQTHKLQTLVYMQKPPKCIHMKRDVNSENGMQNWWYPIFVKLVSSSVVKCAQHSADAYKHKNSLNLKYHVFCAYLFNHRSSSVGTNEHVNNEKGLWKSTKWQILAQLSMCTMLETQNFDILFSTHMHEPPK